MVPNTSDTVLDTERVSLTRAKPLVNTRTTSDVKCLLMTSTGSNRCSQDTLL